MDRIISEIGFHYFEFSLELSNIGSACAYWSCRLGIPIKYFYIVALIESTTFIIIVCMLCYVESCVHSVSPILEINFWTSTKQYRTKNLDHLNVDLVQ